MSIFEQNSLTAVAVAEASTPAVFAPAVGPLSEYSLAVLADPRRTPSVELVIALDLPDPLTDLDFQRALYCLNEVHYRDYADVHPDAEWHPNVTDWWYLLSCRFEQALRSEIDLPSIAPTSSAGDAIVEAIETPGEPSLSEYVLEHASLEILREFTIHRSAYQLKEADPHSFALPRLAGAAKAAFVEIQMDEYGNGKPGHAHAELFAASMEALDLDPTYGRYLCALPATTLATVNLITHLALHRRLLPALLGHLALFELTSVTPMSRYAAAMRAVGCPDHGCAFYDVHVEADEHHGPLARRGLVDAYVAEQPSAAPLAVWGAKATLCVEGRFAASLIDAWRAGRSSLRSH